MRHLFFGILCFVGIGWMGGCNALVGIDKAEYIDAGATLDTGAQEDAGLVACGNGEKRCTTGQCRSDTDPNFGCGSVECAACNIPHAIPGCIGVAGTSATACAINKSQGGGCESGWKDCDGKDDTGCETSLSKKTSCGDCGNDCRLPTPFCVRVGSTYECQSTCQAPNQICDADCVDLQSDPKHCGTCAKDCGNLATGGQTGAVICDAGKCKAKCAAGYHQCGDGCYSDTDPTHCGNSCTQCQQNGVCSAGTCACPAKLPYPCTTGCSANPCTQVCNAKTQISCGGTCCDKSLNQGCCNNTCVDLLNDGTNCGQCGCACQFKNGCSQGQCGAETSVGPIGSCGVTTF